MYETFFHLQGRPFAAAANRHQYYAAGTIQHARSTISRCISRAEGPALLIGPPGTGKTLLCQLLSDDFPSQLDCVHLASGNLGTCRSLLQVILYELGLPYRGLDEGELRLAFLERVTRQRNARGVLLLADEAHQLPARLLEELRLMTNLVQNDVPQVQLVLVGSAELEERLATPKFESLSQRLAARCYLEAFNREETRGYISARIAAAGGDVQRLFAADAMDPIYHATDGVPRLINQLCDHALLLAFAAEVASVDSRVIQEAWSDLQQLPTPWNQTPASDAQASSTSDHDVIEFGTLDDEPATLPLVTYAQQAPAAQRVLPPQQAPATESMTFHSPVPVVEPSFQFAEVAAAAGDEFLEEEVVIDPYAALDARKDLVRHRVTSGVGHEIWTRMAPYADAALRSSVRLAAEPADAPASTTTPTERSKIAPAADSATSVKAPVRTAAETRPAPQSQPAAVSRPPQSHVAPGDPDELIVIDEEAEPLELAKAPGFGRVKRQDYRQLFKKLRSG